MSRISWTLAARDIARHRGRTALIVLLIAVPVAVMTGFGVVVQSTEATRRQLIAQTMGETQALVRPLSVAGCRQRYSVPSCDEEGTPALNPPSARSLFPGHRIIAAESDERGRTPMALSDRDVAITSIRAAAGRPELEGIYHLLAGRATAAENEVVINRRAAQRYGLSVDDTISTDSVPRTVVGVVEDAWKRRPVLFLPPDPQPTSYYLVGPPIPWGEVHQLNARGVEVSSREAMFDAALDPPASSGSLQMQAIIAAAGLLGCLMVGSVAGAAFAVGIRRQRRALALLSATGASQRVLRGVVLRGGAVLGALGALVGGVLGLAGGWIVVARWRDNFYGYNISWIATACFVLIGIAASVVAAWWPARVVLRQDPWTALHTADSASPVHKVPVVGFAFATLGVTAALVATQLPRGTNDGDDGAVLMVLGAIVLLFIGMTCSAGWLLQRAASLGRGAPLAGRLALRDTTRHLGRSFPSLVAVASVAAVGASVLMLFAAYRDQEIRQYQMQAALGQVVVFTDLAEEVSPGIADRVGAAISRSAGAKVEARAITFLGGRCTDEKCVDVSVEVRHPCTNHADSEDWRCTRATLATASRIVVGGAAEFRLMTGRDMSPVEQQAFDAGAMLVPSPVQIDAGMAQVVETSDQSQILSSRDVPAHVVHAAPTAYPLVSANTASRWHLPAMGVHIRTWWFGCRGRRWSPSGCCWSS